MKVKIIVTLLMVCLSAASQAEVFDRGDGMTYDDVLDIFDGSGQTTGNMGAFNGAWVVRDGDVAFVDTDSDGVADSADNCTLVANTDQRDTNDDGYGNVCDPDLDNNGIVNFADVALWAPFFNTATTGDADFDGDGAANFGDYVLYLNYFLQPPGPSGVDSMGPTIVIEGVLANFNTLDAIGVTFQFSEPVSGFDVSDLQVTNGTASGFIAVDGDTFTADVTPDGTGDLTVGVPAGAAQNAAGNPSVAAQDVIALIDAVAPQLVIQGAPTDFTTLAAFGITVQFSEAVTGFSITDILVTNGATSAFTAVDDDTFTVNITPDGAGDLIIAVAAGAAQDGVGNASVAATDVVVANQLDIEAPLLTAISIASNNTNSAYATAGDTVSINMSANEVILVPTVTINGAVADSVTGSGTTWQATRVMLAGDAEGGVTFTLDIEDTDNNVGPQSTVTTDASAVTFDVTAPAVFISGLPAMFESLTPIATTFQFSEDVSDFVLADVTVTNGVADSLVTVGAATYTTNVTPDGSGDLTIAVAMGVAADAAGNTNTAANVSSTEDLPPAWQLVWFDSFDGVVFNVANWTARTDITCPEPCDGQQSYNTNNVSVTGGVLSILAEDGAGPAYVSGFIDSRGKREFKYGRVEIDARMPGTAGAAPSLMMLPVSDAYGAWPLSGEVDIANAPDLGGGNAAVEQSLSYGLPVPENTQTSGSYDSPTAPEKNFITYALEWEAGEIRWFVDSVHVLTQSEDNWYTYSEDSDGVYAVGNGAAPFDEDFYLSLSLAVNDNAGVSSSFPQLLEIDEVRVYECANAVDPFAGTGCSTGDVSVLPVVAADSPYTESLGLYTDGLATVGFVDEAMATTNGTLVAATAVSGGATVTSDPAAEGGTVWSLDIAATSGVADALIQPGVFAGSDAFFDLSGGGTAGELLFRMRVDPVLGGTPVLRAGMEDGTGGTGESDPIPYTADGEWQQYSVKISDIVTDSVLGGTALDLADVFSLFKLSATGGSLNLDIDDIQIKVACRDTNGCEVSPSLVANIPGVVRYSQDFEGLDILGTSVGDGWRYFINVFEGTTRLFGYAGPAPNGPQISAIDTGQGGSEQGVQQLVVYSDYECCAPSSGHRSPTGLGLVETNVFREENLVAADVGKTIRFSFDAKAGNIAGATTASAFIKVLDPMSGFTETIIDEVDMTNVANDWATTFDVQITIGDWEGQILQYGFQSVAGNFEDSAIFYDNVEVLE